MRGTVENEGQLRHEISELREDRARLEDKCRLLAESHVRGQCSAAGRGAPADVGGVLWGVDAMHWIWLKFVTLCSTCAQKYTHLKYLCPYKVLFFVL